MVRFKKHISFINVLYFVVIALMIWMLYNPNKDNTDRFRKMKIEEIINDELNGVAESKYIDSNNHNWSYVNLEGGKVIEGFFLYDIVKRGDSISKKKGSTIYTLYKGDKSDTVVYNAMEFVNKVYPINEEK